MYLGFNYRKCKKVENVEKSKKVKNSKKVENEENVDKDFLFFNERL